MQETAQESRPAESRPAESRLAESRLAEGRPSPAVAPRSMMDADDEAMDADDKEQSLPGRIPDFFIVGHPKCGTTALYEMLRRHPQIHMPAKEPRFFAMKQIDMGAGESLVRGLEPQPGLAQRPGAEPLPGGMGARPPGEIRDVPGRRSHTLAGYMALFAGARPDQRVGEASPAYLRSGLAASRIAAVAPQARIIAILREPTSFLRSFHLQSVRGYNETEKDFRTALALEPERREGRRIPRLSRTPEDLLYSDHVRYVEQLRRYHAVLAPEQVLVLIYEDFKADNRAAVRTVLRFLEVDESLSIEPVQTRPSRDLRFHRLHTLVNLRRMALRNLTVARALSQSVNNLTPRWLRGSMRTRWRGVAYGEPPAPGEELMRELRHRFKPEVEALSAYLNRDLMSMWGYDGLD